MIVTNCSLMNGSGVGSAMGSGEMDCNNVTMDSEDDDDEIDLARTGTLAIIFLLSLFGNVFTIIIVAKFKVHRIPDVLVIGLACTDLVATIIPIPMTFYSYVTVENFKEDSFLCDFYATVAHFTRYSSLIIMTLVSVERYLAINHPFFYRTHATPKRFIGILVLLWGISLVYAILPALHLDTTNDEYEGFCLFDISSEYAVSVLVYGGIQYVIVFVCCVLMLAELLRVYRRRKLLKVREERNKRYRAERRRLQRPPSLTARISDLGKSFAKAAPVITEKFQLGVEAQFARMLLCVVVLFYISWTTVMVMIVLGQIKGSNDGLETGVFWAIRLSVISTAINPFLYGILARQYRLAYAYVIRLWLSRCCTCIEPPLKDVFASARGESHPPPTSFYDRNSRRELSVIVQRQDSSPYMNGHRRARGEHGEPILTSRTPHKDSSLPSFDRLTSDVFLTTIQEESATDQTDLPDMSITKSPTPTPSPHLPQELTSATHAHKQRPDRVPVDFLHELGPTDLPRPGSHNPLAYIADIRGEREVAGSPTPSEQLRDSRLAESPSPECDSAVDRLLPSRVESTPTAVPVARAQSPLIHAQHHQLPEPPQLQPQKEPLRASHSSPLYLDAPASTATTRPCDVSPARGSELKRTKAASVDMLTSEEVDRAFEAVDGIVRNVVLKAQSLQPSGVEHSMSEVNLNRSNGVPPKGSSRNRLSLPELEPPTQLSAGASHPPAARKLTPLSQDTRTTKNGAQRLAQEPRVQISPPASPVYPAQPSKAPRRLSTDNSDSGRESMTFDPEPVATVIDMDPAVL